LKSNSWIQLLLQALKTHVPEAPLIWPTRHRSRCRLCFRYYKALPHQAAAISLLQQDLAANGYQQAMRRDRPWFEAWSQDGKQIDLCACHQPDASSSRAFTSPPTLIRSVAAQPWTIGYGTTRYSGGTPVKQGDKITIIEADMLLRLEVDRIAEKLASSHPALEGDG
jgi:hypothetical protein